MTQNNLSQILLKQIHDGQSHVGEYFSSLFQNFPIGIFWVGLSKDKKTPVLKGCNQWTAEQSGITNKEEVIGKTALEFVEMQKNTQIKKGEFKIIQNMHTDLITNKAPIINNIIPYHRANGTFSHVCMTSLPVFDNNKNITGGVSIFSDIATATNTGLVNASAQYLQLFYQSFNKKKSYYITTSTSTISLTARQAECLTHLSMGKTMKQIANILECSNRTIEDHINVLKRKINVYSTTELINCFWKNPIKWF